jgi:hypothetical protein
MGEIACSAGCFVCGPAGQRKDHIDTGCCGHTMCDPQRWEGQTRQWLTVEARFNTGLWLAVEAEYTARCEQWLAAQDEFVEELRARPKARVRHVRREQLAEKVPEHQRARQRAR